MIETAAEKRVGALGLRLLLAENPQADLEWDSSRGEFVRRAETDATTLDDVIEVFGTLNRVYVLAGEPDSAESASERGVLAPESLKRERQLQLERLSFDSPLEVLARIPPEFIAAVGGGGLIAFLAFFERVFNFPLAIKVQRQRLLEEIERLDADRLENELRRSGIEAALEGLREQAAVLRLAPTIGEIVDLEETGKLTVDQRLKALKRAARVRTARAQLKRDLKSGAVSLSAVLMNPHPEVLSMRVMDALIALPGIGRVKANRILNQCRISPSKTVGALSERQRAELLQQLGQAGER